MDEGDTKYLAFALHESEVPIAAWAQLHKEHPHAYMKTKNVFVFHYRVLPFGLSTSCKVFSKLITALVGFWRRCPSLDGPTRVSSYIDDIQAVHKSFVASLRMAIMIVYESVSASAPPRAVALTGHTPLNHHRQHIT